MVEELLTVLKGMRAVWARVFFGSLPLGMF